jgi:hypothetical protein
VLRFGPADVIARLREAGDPFAAVAGGAGQRIPR